MTIRERLAAIGVIVVLFGGTFFAGYVMGRSSVLRSGNAGNVSQAALPLPPTNGPNIVVLPNGADVDGSLTPNPPTATTAPTIAETATLPPTSDQSPTPSPTIDPNATPTNTPDVTIHTVQSGENLFRIADTYNVTPAAIVAANNLADPSRIQVGQDLIVPLNDVPVPTPTSTLTPTFLPTEAIPTAAELGVIELELVQRGGPAELQGIDMTRIIVMDPIVERNVQAIFAGGQAMGRNPRAFSKIGDSTIENPHFMARFDNGDYDLGVFLYLQDAIDHFQGSFGREGYSVRRGLHSWNLFDPTWVGGECLPEEGPVECEIRVNNPSFIFIRLGSNDVGVPGRFEDNMRRTIEYAIAQGVVPIVGTKADRHEGGNINNDILRALAAEYNVPLWDFDLIAATIPGRGLGPDNVHMTTFFAHDWTSPVAWQRGHGVHTLTGLMALDAVWHVAISE